MLTTAAGDPLARVARPPNEAGPTAVVVPVLDEAARLGPCLDGLCANGPWLREILVVDGGSRDGTHALVNAYAARDPRVVLVDATPVPPDWNGKAWGLQVGLDRTRPDIRWVATVDADVRPSRDLIASLAAHAVLSKLAAFSAAPMQRVRGALQGALHPAFLATLVYRLGLPGNVATKERDVQANGQCFFAERDLLLRTGAIEAAKASPCEDVTLARALVAAGHAVGFFEAGPLAEVEMYADAAECWRNWPRSLPLADARTPRAATALAVAELALVQALPPLLALGLALAGKRESAAFRLNLALALARIGVLAGTRRAYARVAATYWLSPLADLPAVAAIARSAVTKDHTWRGRALVSAEREVA